MLPQTKLDALMSRHAEIEARLNGQLAAEEFVKLSRELSELGPVVDTIKTYRSVSIRRQHSVETHRQTKSSSMPFERNLLRNSPISLGVGRR